MGLQLAMMRGLSFFFVTTKNGDGGCDWGEMSLTCPLSVETCLEETEGGGIPSLCGVDTPPPSLWLRHFAPVLLKTCVSSNHGNGSRAAIDFALDSSMAAPMLATILFSIGSEMGRPLCVFLGMGRRYFRLCRVYLRQFCHFVLAILLGRPQIPVILT